MNRKEAHEKAFSGITAGELRGVLSSASFDPNAKSKLNPSITKGQSKTIFDRALAERGDDFVYRAQYSISSDRKILGGAVTAKNILVEFG